MKEAWRVIIENAKRDPLNNAVLPAVGAALIFYLWFRGWLPWDVIHYAVCHDIGY